MDEELEIVENILSGCNTYCDAQYFLKDIITKSSHKMLIQSIMDGKKYCNTISMLFMKEILNSEEKINIQSNDFVQMETIARFSLEKFIE
jgi:hypothetical protein